MKRKLGDAVNYIIMLIGLVLIVIGIFVEFKEDFSTVFVSVGTSVLATALVSIITAYYLLETENTKKIIKEWGLLALYETKAADMNSSANMQLRECKNHIDIICIGMANFIAYQGNIIVERMRTGVKVRIISCNPNSEFIRQRKRDESPTGSFENVEGICEEVRNLARWVEDIKTSNIEAEIEIKFLNTYPAFSYLRLDDMIFFSSNLYLKPSQQNMAMGYLKGGKGFKLLAEFFEELWKNDTIVQREME